MPRIVSLPDPDPATARIAFDVDPQGRQVVHIRHGDDIVTVSVLTLPDVTQDMIASLRAAIIGADTTRQRFTELGYALADPVSPGANPIDPSPPVIV